MIGNWRCWFRHGKPVLIQQPSVDVPGVVSIQLGMPGCERCGAYIDVDDPWSLPVQAAVSISADDAGGGE